VRLLASLPVGKIVLNINLNKWLDDLVDRDAEYKGPWKFNETASNMLSMLREMCDKLSEVGKQFEVTYRMSSSDAPSRVLVRPGFMATTIGYRGHDKGAETTGGADEGDAEEAEGEGGDDAEVVEEEDDTEEEEEHGSQAEDSLEEEEEEHGSQAEDSLEEEDVQANVGLEEEDVQANVGLEEEDGSEDKDDTSSWHAWVSDSVDDDEEEDDLEGWYSSDSKDDVEGADGREVVSDAEEVAVPQHHTVATSFRETLRTVFSH
jgi:hypothetical protein